MASSACPGSGELQRPRAADVWTYLCPTHSGGETAPLSSPSLAPLCTNDARRTTGGSDRMHAAYPAASRAIHLTDPPAAAPAALRTVGDWLLPAPQQWRAPDHRGSGRIPTGPCWWPLALLSSGHTSSIVPSHTTSRAATPAASHAVVDPLHHLHRRPCRPHAGVGRRPQAPSATGLSLPPHLTAPVPSASPHLHRRGAR